MDFAPTIKRIQAKLGLTADGIAGPKTWAAIENAVGATGTPTGTTGATPPLSGEIDARSERNIRTLSPETQAKAREFLKLLQSAGIGAKIISGYRTYEEQEALYEQGRSKPGNIVTNARKGYSWHNHRVAFDIGIFKDGNYLDESPLYDQAGQIGESIGLEWGGRWTFEDQPHYQWNPAHVTLTQARVMHDENKLFA